VYDKLVLNAPSIDQQHKIPLIISVIIKVGVFILDIIMLNLFIGIVRFYNDRRRNFIKMEVNKVKYRSVNETMDKNEQND
jgi:hypothetical protein